MPSSRTPKVAPMHWLSRSPASRQSTVRIGEAGFFHRQLHRVMVQTALGPLPALLAKGAVRVDGVKILSPAGLRPPAWSQWQQSSAPLPGAGTDRSVFLSLIAKAVFSSSLMPSPNRNADAGRTDTDALMPYTSTGPAMANILAPMPRISPSLLNSSAGETMALAKPVMGTRVPAPAWRAIWS